MSKHHSKASPWKARLTTLASTATAAALYCMTINWMANIWLPYHSYNQGANYIIAAILLLTCHMLHEASILFQLTSLACLATTVAQIMIWAGVANYHIFG